MRPKYLLGLASIAVLVLTGPGLQAQSTSGFVLGEKSLQLAIPDLDPSGVARSQTVSGLASGLVYDLTVRLVVEGTGFGAFNGDYYAYLRHETPDGSQSELVVLLNRVGRGAGLPSGYSDSGFNVTFSDTATWDIHRYQVALGGANDGPLTGTWQPDGRSVNPLVSLDTSARTTSLEPLGNMNPNGSWSLFIADVEAGGTGRLMEWELRGTPRGIIPEPRAVSLFVAGAGLLGWLWRNRRNSVR